MFKKVLVPLDGSALSNGVLPHVRALSACCGSEITLLRIIPEIGMRIVTPAVVAQTVEQTVASLPPVLPDDLSIYEASARSQLEAIVTELATVGLRAKARLGTGPVTEGILDAALEESADLIAMSTHGRSGLSRFLLGSIAGQVIQRASVPVLLVRAKAGATPADACAYRRILVPLDGSDFSRRVLPYVKALAACNKAEVLLLQAIPEPEVEPSEAHWSLTFGGSASLGEVPRWATDVPPSERQAWVESIQTELSRRMAEAKAAAQAQLRDVGRELSAAGIAHEERVQFGAPAEVILDTAEADAVDLIAMTTHGRSGLQRLLLGSVADKVVRHANVPVLLARAQSDK
jgi:nucleotide-binding universal stress UspA family protein